MVAVLFNAGLHVPVIPLLEVAGNAASVAPAQISGTAVNAGVTGAVIVTSRVVVAVAH